jgi:hypothetical protein
MLGDSLSRVEGINPHSWKLCSEAQRAYRNKVHKASKETWRAFCTSKNELPRAARLHTALSKDPKVRLGSLVAPSGECTQSEEETLNLLLNTHFPGPGGVGERALNTFGRTTRLDWQVAKRVVT